MVDPFITSPPADPVPLAEVLYELVSGEEEEFEIRGSHYKRIRIDSSQSFYEVFHGEQRCWLYLAPLSLQKYCTFHRIAEPEKPKEKTLEEKAEMLRLKAQLIAERYAGCAGEVQALVKNIIALVKEEAEK